MKDDEVCDGHQLRVSSNAPALAWESLFIMGAVFL